MYPDGHHLPGWLDHLAQKAVGEYRRSQEAEKARRKTD
jgi:hypothetical protein